MMADTIETAIDVAPKQYRGTLAVAFIAAAAALAVGIKTTTLDDTAEVHDTRITNLEMSDAKRSNDIATITNTLARIEQKLDDRLPDSKEKR